MVELQRKISYAPTSPDNDGENPLSERALIESAENIYYINDGIYGTFNAIIFDHKTFIVSLFETK